jgi:hypothetical protein
MRLPKSTAVALTPRRVSAPSTTSSWISVATWMSSMNAASRKCVVGARRRPLRPPAA